MTPIARFPTLDDAESALDWIGVSGYFPLTADSLQHKTHELSFFSPALVQELIARFPAQEPIDLLRKPDNLTVLSVGELLADTIMNVFADDSVSAIFGGENQLF